MENLALDLVKKAIATKYQGDLSTFQEGSMK